MNNDLNDQKVLKIEQQVQQFTQHIQQSNSKSNDFSMDKRG